MAMNRNGSVLIFVLIFIAFAASTVLLTHEKSIKGMEEASEDFYYNQASIYAMTALSAVAEGMKEDDNSYDTTREEWNQLPVMEIPYGYISVSIKPLNAKISLNSMYLRDAALSQRYLTACENIAQEMEADSLDCQLVKDYLDPDEDVTYGGGEGLAFESNGVEIRTKNMPLATLYELRILMGNNEDFNKIKDYLTVFSPEKGININFASAEVIRAFLPEIAEYADDIADYAKTKDFTDPSNILEAANISNDVYLAVVPFVTVKSSLFYIKTEVTLNDVPRYYHALVRKDGTHTEIVNFLAGMNGQYY